jgi:hypothetical protein
MIIIAMEHTTPFIIEHDFFSLLLREQRDKLTVTTLKTNVMSLDRKQLSTLRYMMFN